MVARALPVSAGSSKVGSGSAAARAKPAPPLPMRPSEAINPTANPFHACNFMTFPFEQLFAANTSAATIWMSPRDERCGNSALRRLQQPASRVLALKGGKIGNCDRRAAPPRCKLRSEEDYE